MSQQLDTSLSSNNLINHLNPTDDDGDSSSDDNEQSFSIHYCNENIPDDATEATGPTDRQQEQQQQRQQQTSEETSLEINIMKQNTADADDRSDNNSSSSVSSNSPKSSPIKVIDTKQVIGYEKPMKKDDDAVSTGTDHLQKHLTLKGNKLKTTIQKNIDMSDVPFSRYAADLCKNLIGTKPKNEDIAHVSSEEDTKSNSSSHKIVDSEPLDRKQIIERELQVLVQESLKPQESLRLQGNSLFLFSTGFAPRRYIFHFIYSKAMYILFHLVILINFILLMIQSDTDRSDKLYNKIYYTDLAFLSFYTIELGLRILASGFLLGSEAVLRKDFWNWMRVIVVVFGWLNFIFSKTTTAYFTPTIFYSVMLIRPFLSLKILTEIRAIIATTANSTTSLFNVVLFNAFLLLVFGLSGVEFFESSMSRKCFAGDQISIQNLACGVKGSAFRCPNHMICRETGNPYFGLFHFDDFMHSIISLFQVTSMSEWCRSALYPLMKAESKVLVAFWMLLMIAMISFVVVNLFIAVLQNLFSKFHEEDEPRPSVVILLISAAKDYIIQKILSRGRSRVADISSIPQNVRTQDEMGSPEDVVDKEPAEELQEIPELHAPHIFEVIDESIWMTRLKFLRAGFIYLRYHSITIIVTAMVHISFLAIAMSQYRGMSSTHTKVVKGFHYSFGIITIFEMLFYLSTEKSYAAMLTSPFNIVDVLCIFCFFLGLAIRNPTLTMIIYLRTIRITEVLLIPRLQRFTLLQKILRSAIDSITPSTDLVGFLLIVLVLYSVIGAQLFQDMLVDPSGQTIRANFDTTINSFLTVFRVVTRDDWTEPMFLAMHNTNWFTGLVFFISLFFITNYVLVNLFTAIVMDNFTITDEDKLEMQKQFAKRRRGHALLASVMALSMFKKNKNRVSPFEGEEEAPRRKILLKIQALATRFFRSTAYNIVVSIAVTAHMVLIALERPSEADKTLRAPSWVHKVTPLEWIFIVLYAAEVSLKMWCFGLNSEEKGSFFESGWNVSEFIISVIVGLATALSYLFPQFSLFKLTRVLIALRLLSINGELKTITSALTGSISGLALVLSLIGFTIVLFSIIGVTLFSGRFDYCTDPDVKLRQHCVGMFLNSNNIYTHRAWKRSPTNFDNSGFAVLTLIEVLTLSSWSDIMYDAIDVSRVDHQPIVDNHPYHGLYFVAFIIITSFFSLQLLTGVIIEQIQLRRNVASLTTPQRQYANFKKSIILLKPKHLKTPPTNKIRLFVFNLVEHRYFEFAMLAATGLNVIFLATRHADESPQWNLSLLILNTAFTALFTIESALKIFAYGFRGFFSNTINVVDFINSSCVILGLILEYAFLGKKSFRFLVLIRLFRILSALRVIKRSKGLNALVETLVASLPSIVWILVILCVIFYIYTVIGMAMFGHIKYQQELNYDANFRTFFRGFLTMFRVLTQDNWNNLYRDFMLSGNSCTKTATFNDCGSPVFTYFFFLSFIILASYIVFNLFIAVIIDNFMFIFQWQKFFIAPGHIQEFCDVWAEYDPYGSGLISSRLFGVIIHQLFKRGNPLGFDIKARENKRAFELINFELMNSLYSVKDEGAYDPITKLYLTISRKLNAKVLMNHDTQYISFHDTILVLARRCLPREAFQLSEIEDYENNVRLCLLHLSAVRIQRVFKNSKKRKNLKNLLQQATFDFIQARRDERAANGEFIKLNESQSDLAERIVEDEEDDEARRVEEEGDQIVEDGSNNSNSTSDDSSKKLVDHENIE